MVPTSSILDPTCTNPGSTCTNPGPHHEVDQVIMKLTSSNTDFSRSTTDFSRSTMDSTLSNTNLVLTFHIVAKIDRTLFTTVWSCSLTFCELGLVQPSRKYLFSSILDDVITKVYYFLLWFLQKIPGPRAHFDLIPGQTRRRSRKSWPHW